MVRRVTSWRGTTIPLTSLYVYMEWKGAGDDGYGYDRVDAWQLRRLSLGSVGKKVGYTLYFNYFFDYNQWACPLE